LDHQKIFAEIEKNQDFLLDTLRSMLKINTVNPPGLNYDKMADLLEPIYESLGYQTKRVIVPPEKLTQIPYPIKGDRVNVVASKQFGKPPICIYGHIDVVPVENNWTHDAFGGEVVGGRIYGRGTVDMKGQIACLITALKIINDLKITPQFDINCMMCTDEEVGVYPGAYHLALEGYFKGQLMWLEPGFQEPVTVSSAAGNLNVTITVKGKASHSGRNWMGVNALEESVPILVELVELKKKVQAREAKEGIVRTTTGSRKLTPLFNVDVIHSGVKANIVPDLCTIIVNRRYIYEENYDDVAREINEAVNRGQAKSKALGVEISFSHSYSPTLINTNSRNAVRARKVRSMVHGFVDFMTISNTSSIDLGFVQGVTGTNDAVAFGTDRESNGSAHAGNEYAEISDLLSLAKEIALYLTLEDNV